MDLRVFGFKFMQESGFGGASLKPRRRPIKGQIVIDRTGLGPDSSRNAHRATFVDNLAPLWGLSN